MYQRILVPFDGSPTSLRGLDEAIEVALATGARLRLVHLADDLAYATGFETYAAYANEVLPCMRQAGNKILQDGKTRAAKAGVNADTLLLEGSATRLADAVAEQASSWAADLIVIGTHGRRGVGRWLLGSDAEQILRTAPAPVLLVRAAADLAGAPAQAPADAAPVVA